MQLAAMKGHTETVKLLLEQGAQIEGVGGYFKQTPLHYAAENGHTETVKLLLEQGAKIEAVEEYLK